MEKEKNNAVEKVENVGKENATSNKKNAASVSEKNPVRKSENSSSAKGKKKGNVKRSRSAAEKKRKKLAAKAEKERVRAEKRVEIARIKAHKKAEKEKAKAAVLRDKARRKAEAAEKKRLLKEERAKRRDMIKHESKKDRAKRIALERVRLIEERKEEKQRKAELKKQRFLAKKERKEKRALNKQKNRENRKGFGGWLAAVISLGVSTLVLASVLTFTFLMPTESDNLLESAYRRAFYDAVEQVDNIDVNLSKTIASSDSGAMQDYLVKLAVNSELAENDLQSLPLKDESKFNTVKLVNQIGDYAKYLNKKLINGESLSLEERETLKKLYAANLTLKDSLQKTVKEMKNDFSFLSMVSSGENGNAVSEGFNELENLSVEYPELIYDGPFSDGADNREIKGLPSDKIDEKTAKEVFTEIFGDCGLKEVKNAGTSEGAIRCFNVSATVKDSELFAQISEYGGKLIGFSYAGSCGKTAYDGDYATEKGLEFLAKNGFESMRPVWINLSDNVYTINYAAYVDDVIVYPDMVKIRVCAETAEVIGMEASSYYTNHTERKIEKTAITAEQAKSKVYSEIETLTCRKAIVPVGESSEKLCYEIFGNLDGSVYFVYIDAATGKQTEMFKVIDSAEGELLV